MYRTLSRRFLSLAMSVVAIVALTASASAQSNCFRIHGTYEEHIAPPTACSSPIGFCIEGEFSGKIKGPFVAGATSFVSTMDTMTTTVTAFTSDTVIHATVKGMSGDLIIKNAGIFQQSGDGNILDLQLITGGTGELTGASGAIRASGTFDLLNGVGVSDYEGTLCLP